MSQLELLFALICIFCLVESVIAKYDPYEEYSYYVRVGRSLTNSEEDLCGGVLISSTVIVTTAACFYVKSENRWAKNETEIFAHFLRYPLSLNFDSSLLLDIDYYVVHPLYDPVMVFSRGALSMNDIAFVVLKEKVDSKRAYLRPCYVEEDGGYGYEGYSKSFSLTSRINNYTRSFDWEMNIRYVGQYRYSDGTYCPGAPGMDKSKQVCYRVLSWGMQDKYFVQYFKDWEIKNGDPLVGDERGSLCWLGIGSRGFGNPLRPYFLFTRADWAFDWINSTVGAKLEEDPQVNEDKERTQRHPLFNQFDRRVYRIG